MVALPLRHRLKRTAERHPRDEAFRADAGGPPSAGGTTGIVLLRRPVAFELKSHPPLHLSPSMWRPAVLFDYQVCCNDFIFQALHTHFWGQAT